MVHSCWLGWLSDELIFSRSLTDYYRYYGGGEESSAISFAWVSLVPVRPLFSAIPFRLIIHIIERCHDDVMILTACGPWRALIIDMCSLQCLCVCVAVSRVVLTKRLWTFWTSLLSECLYTNWYAADAQQLNDQKISYTSHGKRINSRKKVHAVSHTRVVRFLGG